MKKALWLFLFLLLINNAYSQTLEISLKKILTEYSLASPEAKKARLEYENAGYGYENYRKGFLPSVSFILNPASFNHSYRVLQNPSDGNYSYVEDFSNNSSVGVAISQQVGITGGAINVGSNLNMLTEFYDKRKSFSTSPFTIGYSQKLFGGEGADYKFVRNVERKKNEKAAKDYCSDITDIQREAIRLYLDLFLVKVSMDMASKNQAVSDTLLRASTVKYENGRMVENEYLQMQIQAVNDRFAYENYKKEYDISLRRLLSYLGMTDNYNNYTVESPNLELPQFLDLERVVEYAEKNNPFALGQQIRKIEAEKSVHAAKYQNRLTGNINFNLGMNQYASVFADAYKNPASQQSLTIGLQIPVFQWGINKNSLKIAQNNYEISMMEIDREYVLFYNDLKEQVNNYNHDVNLMNIAKSSYELVLRQYDVSVDKFDLGKISVYELGIAQKEVFTSMNQYYTSVKEVWDGYYRLRNTTLIDFAENRELTEILLR